MKNTNKITYKKIDEYLSKNNITSISKISTEEEFFTLQSLLNAQRNDITFFSNNSPINNLISCKAKACLINRDNSKFLPKNTLPIIVEDPYKSFAIISNLFFNDDISNNKISEMSIINEKVKIKKNVQIDPYVHIKQNSKIEENVIIGSNCTIGPDVTIEKNTIIKSNSVIKNAHVGKNCIIKSGAVIGGTGFGFEPKTKIRIQHIGNVIIKDNCNIGSNTTIDRAVFDSTIISENCFIDNLVQIAHNVIIGRDTIIAAQTGIAGSAKIGDNVTIGGQVGISGHIKIGKNVIIAAKSGVTKNIKDNSTVAGFPAIDIKKWKLTNIKLNKL